MEIYSNGGGVEFLRSVQKGFPKGAPKLGTAQVLQKLESLTPGWENGAKRVEAGDIKPITLRPAVARRALRSG